MTATQILRTLVDPVLQTPGSGKIQFTSHPPGNAGFLSFMARPVDMPRLIGRQGANIRALRLIIETPGLRLAINQDGDRVPPPAPVPPLANWKPDAVVGIVGAMLAWRGMDPHVHPIADGDRWKLCLMERGTGRELYEAMELWAITCARSVGGNLYFEDYLDAQCSPV